MDFNKIKEICEQHNITIPELADKVGLSKAGLYRTIQQKTMKVETLEKISQVLNVPISDFFDMEIMKTLKDQIKEWQDDYRRKDEIYTHTLNNYHSSERRIKQLEEWIEHNRQLFETQKALIISLNAQIKQLKEK